MSRPLHPQDRAAKLCGDNIGSITESEIANAIADAEFDTLNFPVEIAVRHFGEEALKNVKAFQIIHALCGPLAERLADDMDRRNKDHSKWYKEVQRARSFLAELTKDEE